jgi:hypothetical protein
VQLVEALGGGWDASQIPTPSQVLHQDSPPPPPPPGPQGTK